MSSEEQYQYDIIHAEDSELTSGYTTISSNQSEFVPIKVRQQSKEETKRDETQMKNAENPKSSTKKALASLAGQKDQNPNAIGKSSKSKTQSFLDPSTMAA